MPLSAPTIPSRYEDTNVPVRGLDDDSFSWRMEGISGIDLGGTTVDHYHLQITPDLGWDDHGELFTLYSAGTGNSRLHEYETSVDGTPTEDGERVIFDLDDILWSETIRPRFHRYLWRVAAVETDETVGAWSDVQTFTLISEIPDANWSVDDLSDPEGWIQIVTGSLTTDIEAIEVLGYDPESVIGEGRWRVEVPLQAADTVLFLRARNIRGETGTYRTISTKLKTTVSRTHKIWNAFDEFGALLSTPRHDGEGNIAYRQRLTDVFVHRGSPRYYGLRNTLTRDLNYLDDQVDQALIINRAFELSPDEIPLNAVRMIIRPGAVHLYGDFFKIHQETHVVDGHTWSFQTTELVEDQGIQVNIDGRDVPFTAFSIGEDQRTVGFRFPTWNGRKAYVSYRYREEVSMVGLTLTGLKTALEAVTVRGKQLLSVTIATGATSLAAEGLDLAGPIDLSNTLHLDMTGTEVEGVPLRWSPVRVFALQDPAFLDLYRNEFGNHFHTRVDGWASTLRSRMQMSWDRIVADRGFWFSRGDLHGHAGLVVTMDLPKLFWISTYTGKRYTTRQYMALGGLCPSDGSFLVREGIPISRLKSGVAAGLALKVRMSETVTLNDSTPNELLSVVQEQNVVRPNDSLIDSTNPETPTS